MLGSIKGVGGDPWIIEGKKGEDGNEGDTESGRQDERREQKDKGCRDHKQRMRFQGRGLRSSASFVLMASESMADEAYYVAKIMFNNGTLTDDNINKHGEVRAEMTRFEVRSHII